MVYRAGMKTFRSRALAVVAKIPRGRTMSYKEVAAAAGSPNAARAVGSLMAKNYDPKIPCHRVIKSDGTSGQYNRGAAEKIKILKSEGALKAQLK